ncbi:MAG TPA: glycosyltransferase family 2 protein [Flavobacteriales bacterium]|nr:glycosyltransferase family 2 protein [Flavobacteriales bacterium]HRE96171.1 glycosyltransferase family 2 protein [Flavobacteriales bacterium]HRJ37496.1 glycosyltransferase family 2 protein [Flavobacteriales bacterium]
MGSIDISVVVPVFNEKDNVGLLVNRIIAALKTISSSYELILVDDGSSDGTFDVIEKLNVEFPELKAVSLSRNFGHQVALTAGLEHASGNYIITLDGDLQHPPELIPTLIAEAEKGYDIVNTIRGETADATVLKNVTAKGFYQLINFVSDVTIVPGAADFRLMTRKALNAFLQIPERDRFTRGLVSWMGFEQCFVPFSADKRHSGKSKYNFRRMIRFAWDGVTSFSSRPLRISFYMGLIASGFGLLYAIYAIIAKVSGNVVEGWTSLLIVVLLMGGIQLISIGIIGEYLARVFTESKRRPLYFIKRKVGEVQKSDQSAI